jgi:flagellar hook-associated protein 2
MAVSFSGLASGLNTSQLISQLVAVERNATNGLTQQQSDISSQKSILGNLTNQLSALKSVATDMKSAAALQFRTATVSDSHVTIAAAGSAVPTVHDVRVVSTAAAQVVTSYGFDHHDTAGITGTGGVDITTGGGTPVHVAWDATDTLDSIAGKINAANTSVGASILYDGSKYRLVLNSKQTGLANAAVFSESDSALGLGDPANVRIPAKDAQVTLDGIPITRPTNVISDAIPGLTITAISPHAAADSDTVATIGIDTGAIQNKLQSFVTAYNAVNSVIAGQLTYFGTKKGNNTLFGDSTLRQLQGHFTTLMTSAYGGVNLGSLGLSRDKTGAMTLDATKLTAALAADPSAVEKLFVDGGLASKVADYTDQYARGSDGIIALKGKAMDARSKLLQSQIDQINTNADQTQSRLQTQFNNLEKAMSALQSQSSYISKLFATTTTA